MFLNVLFLKKSILRRKPVLAIEKLPLLYYPGMQYGYNTLLSNLPSIICQVVAYGRLKTKENFSSKSLGSDPRVVRVA